MRLFLIDKPECRHISEIMKGIKAVYQMESEFYPYLLVEFLPNKGEPAGIILLAGNERIRKYYTFDDPNDIEDLRLLIWKYLLKYHKIKDITKNGCITDFRQTETNKVIQGWQAKKRSLKGSGSDLECCKVIRDMVTSEFAAQLIKHEVYRVNTNNMLDRRLCKKVRYEHCGNNFPPNTDQFGRCVDEADWICNNGYPQNKRTEYVLKVRDKLKKNILNYLKSNNMKVNKQILDLIFSAGFFERVSNRMGNKYMSYKHVKHAVTNEMTNDQGILELIEGFDQTSKNRYYLGLSIIFVICILIFVLRNRSIR